MLNPVRVSGMIRLSELADLPKISIVSRIDQVTKTIYSILESMPGVVAEPDGRNLNLHILFTGTWDISIWGDIQRPRKKFPDEVRDLFRRMTEQIDAETSKAIADNRCEQLNPEEIHLVCHHAVLAFEEGAIGEKEIDGEAFTLVYCARQKEYRKERVERSVQEYQQREETEELDEEEDLIKRVKS